jgi:hypothetical protein
VSTVPPNVLAALPSLPDDVQYRFLGRHLVLHGTRANVILDPDPVRDQVRRALRRLRRGSQQPRRPRPFSGDTRFDITFESGSS